MDPDQWPDPDPDAITDKGAFEREVADSLASMLLKFDPEMGEYAISLAAPTPIRRSKSQGATSGPGSRWTGSSTCGSFGSPTSKREGPRLSSTRNWPSSVRFASPS